MAWFRKKQIGDRQHQVLATAKRQMESHGKLLKITPPEGVPLEMPIASLGLRFGAQFIDFVITVVAAFALVYLLLYAFQDSFWIFVTLFYLIFFLIRVPYYILCELAWNGRTLAKRWLGIRVVSANGRSLTPHQIVARNIMKEIEFFAPLSYSLYGHTVHWSFTVIALVWLLVLIVVLWRSKNSQRIGDIIANTAVIENIKPMLKPEIAEARTSDARFVFTTAQLDHYGRFELQTLEQVLRAPTMLGSEAERNRIQYETEIMQRIAQKIEYPEAISYSDRREFLQEFYTAQRAHLENRKLFGDARDDKFFKEEKQTQ